MNVCNHNIDLGTICTQCDDDRADLGLGFKVTGAAMARGQSKQDYETPDDFMAAVVKRFGRISFDLAASKENSKAEHFYTIERNALSQDWVTLSDRVANLWLNPPFDHIAPWAAKCAKEGHFGARVLLLTPASIGANWFRDHVHRKALVLGLNGRLTFKGTDGPYPKDCMLSVFGVEPGFDVWSWRE